MGARALHVWPPPAVVEQSLDWCGVVVVLEGYAVLKDLNALGSVFRISTRQTQFRRALASLIRRELQYHGEEDQIDPPSDGAPHRRRDK
eukprot:5881949-Pyramimonas_sp.AAC.1